MVWRHFIWALSIAVILTGVFIAGFRKRGPWDNFLIFFFVVFLGSWAGGIWFAPLGPTVWKVHVLPFLLVGLIFALLLAAAVPSIPPDTTVQLVEEGKRAPEKRKEMVLGIYFWLMVSALLVLIVTRYF